MKDENVNKANCLQCVHFAVTWQPKQPNACKLFGFQSAVLPSAVVYQSAGVACLGFVKKAARKEK